MAGRNPPSLYIGVDMPHVRRSIIDRSACSCHHRDGNGVGTVEGATTARLLHMRQRCKTGSSEGRTWAGPWVASAIHVLHCSHVTVLHRSACRAYWPSHCRVAQCKVHEHGPKSGRMRHLHIVMPAISMFCERYGAACLHVIFIRRSDELVFTVPMMFGCSYVPG